MSENPTAATQETTQNTPAEGDADKAFTQADVDRIVAERLARNERKYADYDEVKSKAQKFAELEEANASDLEKAVKAARDEVTKELTQKHLAERLLDKVEVAAAGKFADPEDARLRLSARLEEFIKDGQIDTDGINVAIEKVLEDHPHLRAAGTQGAPSPARAGIGVTGGQSPASPAQQFARIAEQALGG